VTGFYTVTDEDGAYTRTYPDTPARHGEPAHRWAMDVEDAARLWAERWHSDLDYPDEMTAIVTDPNGKTWRVVVTVEQTITLTANRPEEVTE